MSDVRLFYGFLALSGLWFAAQLFAYLLEPRPAYVGWPAFLLFVCTLALTGVCLWRAWRAGR